MKNLIKASIVLVNIILLAACGTSSKLVGTWKNDKLSNNSYQKLAVVAVFPNYSNRYLNERAVVKDLNDANIKAIPTYEIFPFAGKMGEIVSKSENPEALKERIKKKVEENNIDAIMIISVLDAQKEQRFVQDRSNYNYMGGTGYYGTPVVVPGAAMMPFAYGAYYNYYSYNVGHVYTSGYYVDDITYFVEFNLYDVGKEELLWSAQTKSMNINSVEEEAPKIASMVVKDLLSKNVIVP